jgi:hypothetical protein
MDRSFLSNQAVIAASRDFVCIRLLSYEDKDEMAFLKTFGAGKSGEVENTVFCMVAPDGNRLLTRATREPRGSAVQLADSMIRVAKDFPPKARKQPTREIPLVASVRLALNVAACDRQPLVLVRGGDEKLRAAMSELAWSPDFVGKFVYAIDSRIDKVAVEGLAEDASIQVIDPDTFGAKGKVIGQVTTSSSQRLAAALTASLAKFQRSERNFWQHVKTGQSQGVFWETLTPVTDPMELRAREKGRKKPAP